MGKHILRDDKECANCGYTVDLAYCSKCGQQNTETRQSFHHLITHFVEDLTHYDGAFWKTIKFLLFRPAKLTKEYLEGHRQRYVPPVKLYIFISFITFFFLSLFASALSGNTEKTQKFTEKELSVNRYRSVTQLDSVQRSLPEIEKMGALEYRLTKKMLELGREGISLPQLLEALIHTAPKVLFIYMPIFAFWLWLIHGKKRWYFFDHGIFTLHFFSFLLLLYCINVFMPLLISYISKPVADIVSSLLGLLFTCYSIFYFFRAHSHMYGERKIISRLKGFLLFIINLVCITAAITFTILYVLFTLH